MLVRSDIELSPGAGLAAKPSVSSWSFNDWGDRVVQVVQLPLANDRSISLLHTHLTFPHQNGHDPPMRQKQAGKLAELINQLQSEGPLMLFGDLNGDLQDAAVASLQRSAQLTPMPDKGSAWVSHVAHTGAPMACDHVFTRGSCKIGSWDLGYSEEGLLAGTLLSDHRPLHAEVQLLAAVESCPVACAAPPGQSQQSPAS
uniref:Endonuclease/exonuclease/phosphatase domain-containing protein n=1 Tax=Haptolina ericina TaxID=156174 RepID=A0A7S3AKZ2_9EUKA|mmetsp:Transcript_24169/g.54982  ORF Transcript_24169/g.54982 Transcript_24169/m.54982 type:complete len:200 (+) Transcript_24169:522-1121(+)